MMTWNEWVTFYNEEQLGMLFLIMGVYILALGVKNFKGTKKEMQYRSKEQSNKKAGK